MANKRARDRQLAKLAARRQAERRARRRRRVRVAAVVVVVALGLAVTGVAVLAGGGDGTSAATSSPSASPSHATATCSTTAPKAAGEHKPTFDHPPKMTIDPSATYTATMKTSCGTVVMQLLPDVAPIGVNNFVFLARQGFYDGLTFHRIVKDFVIQGGDPNGDGTGGPGYQFKTETSPKVTFDDAGVVAYANSGPDTNGSQFFITLGPQPGLNPTASASYSIFGRVTKGMNVVQKIGSFYETDPADGDQGSGTPTQTVYIDSIAIDEQR